MPCPPARPAPAGSGGPPPTGGLRCVAAHRPVRLFLALAFGWASAWCLGLWLLDLSIAPGSAATHQPALAGPGIAAAVTL